MEEPFASAKLTRHIVFWHVAHATVFSAVVAVYAVIAVITIFRVG